MTNQSRYLLLIDGSLESQAAVRVCSELAQRTKASVTGLHVVNTALLWRTLAFATPGLVGSGPYLAAYEEMRAALRKLGESILDAYQSKFGHLVKGPDSVRIEEGDPAEIVQNIYLDYDLIIAGHRPLWRRGKESTSLCQSLAADGARPMLLVQQENRAFSSLRLVIGEGVPSLGCLEKVLSFASTTDLKREFMWTGSAAGYHNYAPIIGEFWQPSEHVTNSNSEPPIHSSFDADWRPEVDSNSEALHVFFTKKQLGRRVTLQADDTTDVLYDVPLPAFLLWPTEYSPVVCAPVEAKSAIN